MDSKFFLELGKRIKDNGGARENKMFQSISVSCQKNGVLPGRDVEINIGNSTEGKEKYKSKREGDRNSNGQQKKVEANGVANAFVQDFCAIYQKGVGVAGPVEEDFKKHKHKDSDGRDDGIRPNKLPRLISSSSHQLVENGRKLEPHQTALQVMCERHAAENNHKVEVKVSSSHQMLQNGRKLDPNPTAIQSGSESQKVSNSGKTDKDVRINGFIEAQQLNACSSKLPSIPTQAKVKFEASAKLPHPDSKYLSRILSLPQVAEWSDFDDQEWWFNRDKIHSEKPKLGSFEVDGTPQVWVSALRIESVEVTALPYVIPF
ncbi:hypothetical protein Acr_15g0004800 [Actinidia rufa]|uniref:Uncharacterized protein n=1 Tax=Actinidia rufa TaxID=165716 RepID=A0A7J0FT60_9ERIC|nr:hypothetical protein Acr_15g0004800 [Actinidia rufa]